MIRQGNTAVAPGEAVVDISRAEDLEAFDALPPPIRDALNDAPRPIAATPLLAFWRDEDGATGLDCMDRLNAILDAIRNPTP